MVVARAGAVIASCVVAGLVLRAGVAAGAPAVDAERPGGVAPTADAWPVAIVDRPLTLARGMAAAALTSQSYWSPGSPARSYLGPTATLAVHDRVEVAGGLPSALCWDGDARACAGGSALDRMFLGLGFAIRRCESLALAAGLSASIERWRAPGEHRSSIWFIARRTWWHRLAFVGRGELGIGWDHPVTATSTPGPPQSNQTRLSWTEEAIWQVAEPFALFAYGNPYRPIGAPGDESWATRVGGGVTLAVGPRWLFVASCSVDNVMPARRWQYVPDGKDCGLSLTVFHLPR